MLAHFGSRLLSSLVAALLLGSSAHAVTPTYPYSYSLSCTGTTGAGAHLSLVGRMQINGPTSAIGGVEFVNGSIIQFASFTATLTEGFANAQGVGGSNSIPRGCFQGSALFSGDTFGVLSGFFGCYNDAVRGFDLTQTSSNLGAGTVLTCQGKEM